MEKTFNINSKKDLDNFNKQLKKIEIGNKWNCLKILNQINSDIL